MGWRFSAGSPSAGRLVAARRRARRRRSGGGRRVSWTECGGIWRAWAGRRCGRERVAEVSRVQRDRTRECSTRHRRRPTDIHVILVRPVAVSRMRGRWRARATAPATPRIGSRQPGDQVIRHRTTWEDDRMVGIDCYVITQKARLSRGGVEVESDVPTDGGSVSTDEESACASCGQRLRLVWNVCLVEVQSEPEVHDAAH